MTKLSLLFLVFAALCISIADARSEQQSRLWKAQWITSGSAADRDLAIIHFRKSIELARQPSHFIVNVSADNQFIFYVNGHRVGSGPSRAELAHWRYETYDLAPFLTTGSNVLAATVWNFGARGAVAQMSDRLGFVVHGNSEAERIADTDSTWEAEAATGIGILPADIPDFYYAAEPGIILDASKFDWSWSAASPEHQESWSKAVPLSAAALRGQSDPPNNWQLVADPLPPMEMALEPVGSVVRAIGVPKPTEFPNGVLTVPSHTNASVLLDRGPPDHRVSGVGCERAWWNHPSDLRRGARGCRWRQREPQRN